MQMIIYIAGPMSGYPDYNRPAFMAMAEELRSVGHEVRNPAELDLTEEEAQRMSAGNWSPRSREYYMLRDFRLICGDGDRLDPVDAVYVLPGWEQSPGARKEIMLAHEIGAQVIDAETAIPLEPHPHLEAEHLVYGNRNEDYGHPMDDYEATAKIWSGILAGILKRDITAEEAIMCMVGVKLSRQSRVPKKDNITDGIGYWECLYRTQVERARREQARCKELATVD